MPTTVFSQTSNRIQRVVWVGVPLGCIALFAIFAFDYWRSGEFGWYRLISTVLGMLLGGFSVWAVHWIIGPGMPRTLTLDDQGLTYAFHRASRRWTWAELSTAEICSRKPRTDPYVRIRVDAIEWKTRWTLMESLSKAEIRLHAIYDAPLRDICDKLNEYRDRALADDPTAPAS